MLTKAEVKKLKFGRKLYVPNIMHPDSNQIDHTDRFMTPYAGRTLVFIRHDNLSDQIVVVRSSGDLVYLNSKSNGNFPTVSLKKLRKSPILNIPFGELTVFHDNGFSVGCHIFTAKEAKRILNFLNKHLNKEN